MKVTGWIAKNGKIIECEPYEHLSLFGNHPQALDDIGREWYGDSIDGLRYIEKESDELSERGEHPEWHVYEMASDDFRHECLDRLYRAGYIRFGTMRIEMHFEAYSQFIKDKYQKCVDLAESYGMRATFNNKGKPS